MRRTLPASLAAAFVLLGGLPGTLLGQGAAPATIPQDSIQFYLQRFQALQQQVGALQQEVMNTTPALQTRQTEVAGMVEARVYRIDPTLQGDIRDRMPAIAQRAQAAEAVGDTLALRAAQQEYVVLRTRAEEAEQAALLEPDIQAQVDAFEAALRTELESRNPAMRGVLSELEQLAERLDATLGGG